MTVRPLFSLSSFSPIKWCITGGGEVDRGYSLGAKFQGSGGSGKERWLVEGFQMDVSLSGSSEGSNDRHASLIIWLRGGFPGYASFFFLSLGLWRWYVYITSLGMNPPRALKKSQPTRCGWWTGIPWWESSFGFLLDSRGRVSLQRVASEWPARIRPESARCGKWKLAAREAG